MADVFLAAWRRIEGHFAAITIDAHNVLDEAATDGLLHRIEAIQEILYAVGLQALDEHAEWLILHRSRPLEPVMAG